MKRWSSFLEIGFSLFLGILLTFTSLEAKAKVEFSIVYSNDMMGEVEPCG